MKKNKKVSSTVPVYAEKGENRLITDDKSEKLAYLVCTYKNYPHVALKVQKGKKNVYYTGRQALMQVLEDNNIYAQLVTDDWCLIQCDPKDSEKIRKTISDFCKVQITIRKNNNQNLSKTSSKKPTNNTEEAKKVAHNTRKERNKINAARRIKHKMSRAQKKITKKVETVKSSKDKIVLTHSAGINLSSAQRSNKRKQQKKAKRQNRTKLFKVNQKMWFELKHSNKGVLKDLNTKHEFKKNNGKPIQQKLKFANQKTEVKQAA